MMLVDQADRSTDFDGIGHGRDLREKGEGVMGFPVDTR
jgi:hypothetical protein